MFILFLVAMSIMWIPIIQELQGGQLFIYIQAISAYLSPPIAIVYCMAISWGRMNEKVRGGVDTLENKQLSREHSGA